MLKIGRELANDGEVGSLTLLWKAVCADARPLTGKDSGAALDTAAKSDRAVERKVAVTGMGALDDLPRLLGVLAASPHAGDRDHAVLVLRHWLGRAPGRTKKLADALAKQKLTAVQATTVLDLLYGFEPERRRDPATFELLIDDLKHSRPEVRQLAHWHLTRLTRAGDAIAYDALAPEAERAAAFEQWRTLVPPGKLPPAKK